MRTYFLSLIPLILLQFACSKDKEPFDENCGLALQIHKTSALNDGGIRESVSIAACGLPFRNYVERAETWQLTIFYKGQTRKLAKYLVCALGTNLTLYIRYESGQIPSSSVKYYEDKGYEVSVKEMTGLEQMTEL